VALYSNKEYEKSIILLNQCVQLDSNNFNGNKYLILAYYALNNNLKACEAYIKFKKKYGEIDELKKIKCP
jgi:tetratricopeptide (TPR) repeat protein